MLVKVTDKKEITRFNGMSKHLIAVLTVYNCVVKIVKGYRNE